MPERNITRHIVLLTALFVSALLTGFLAPIPGKVDLFGDLKASLEPYATLTPVKMFAFILFNNSVKTFVVLVLGILFGLLPLIAVATNRYILRRRVVPEAGVARMSLGGNLEHQRRKPAFAGLVVFGAGGGGRTRTALRPRDFESRASASSTTPARTFDS